MAKNQIITNAEIEKDIADALDGFMESFDENDEQNEWFDKIKAVGAQAFDHCTA